MHSFLETSIFHKLLDVSPYFSAATDMIAILVGRVLTPPLHLHLLVTRDEVLCHLASVCVSER